MMGGRKFPPLGAAMSIGDRMATSAPAGCQHAFLEQNRHCPAQRPPRDSKFPAKLALGRHDFLPATFLHAHTQARYGLIHQCQVNGICIF